MGDSQRDTGTGKFTVKVDPDLEDILPLFLRKRHEDLAALGAALERGDFDAVRRLGHDLKGLCGGYGFDGMSEIGARLEVAAKDLDPDAIRPLLADLASYLERLVVVFE